MKLQVKLNFSDLFSKSASFCQAYNWECYKDIPSGCDKECVWWLGGENKQLLSADPSDLVATVNGYAWAIGHLNGHWEGNVYCTNGYYFMFIGTLDGQDIQLLRYIR